MFINSSNANKLRVVNSVNKDYQTTNDDIITCTDVVKNYKNGRNITRALGPVSFQVRKGEFFGIYGRSGSGKSTLMNILTSLDSTTTGEIKINQRIISKIKGQDLREYRGSVGIIFQSYNLLPNLNVIDNIIVASWASNRVVNTTYAKELMEKLGISKLAKMNIKNLSGGEKQRVAIARALINKPTILFCDEPTGALDFSNEKQVIEILKDLNNTGITVVMITHNSEFEEYFDRFITLNDGKITNQLNLK